MLTPVLKHVKNNLGKRVEVFQIIIDLNQDIAKQYKVNRTELLKIAISDGKDEIAFIKYVVKYTNCFWRYK